ncbi:transposase [Roseiarcus sp.]|uniref:transposase n=1 Tax=Roseiarcus sp. TaxID=1969460 RepID=UPI003F9BE6E4
MTATQAVRKRIEVATDVVQPPNDKNQVKPMLEKIEALPGALGEVEHLLADTGYFSAGNVEACEKAGVEPMIRSAAWTTSIVRWRSNI